MTNEELFADLKQFIEATVSQQTAHLDGRIDGVEKRMGDVEQQLGDVEQRLAARIDIVDEKLDLVQDAIGDNVQDHEQRLRRLERRTA